MLHQDAITNGWSEYELCDSGNNRKLERFGRYLLDRPDPQALWNKSNPTLWADVHARFAWKSEGERWTSQKDTPESWIITYNDISIQLAFAQFKHIGIFPEHQAQWEHLETIIKESTTPMRVLNLFGYTGVASLVAAKAGAFVTHVDASKTTIATVKENSERSGLPKDSIRVITEDAYKYARRLIERKEIFDIILLDPPAFGRGPKGEVWKIEEKLPELIALIPTLLSKDAKMVTLNGYAAGYSARSFAELLQDYLPKGDIVYGDVGIAQKDTDRILPTGIYATWAV